MHKTSCSGGKFSTGPLPFSKGTSCFEAVTVSPKYLAKSNTGAVQHNSIACTSPFPLPRALTDCVHKGNFVTN